jgi:hypothetical protein
LTRLAELLPSRPDDGEDWGEPPENLSDDETADLLAEPLESAESRVSDSSPEQLLQHKLNDAEWQDLLALYQTGDETTKQLDQLIERTIGSGYDAENQTERNKYRRAVTMKVFLENPSFTKIKVDPDQYSASAEIDSVTAKAIFTGRLERVKVDFPIRPPEQMTYAEYTEMTSQYNGLEYGYLHFLGYAAPDVLRDAMRGRVTDHTHKNGLATTADEQPFNYSPPDVNRLKEVMEQYTDRMYDLGPENISRLRRDCGIVNFDIYSSDLLAKQVKWLDNDPETLKHFSSEDTRVALFVSDGINDETGAFANLQRNYMNVYDESLVFETSLTNHNESNVHSVARREVGNYWQLVEARQPHYTAVALAGHGNANGHMVYFGDSVLTSKYYDLDEQLDTEVRLSDKKVIDVESSAISNFLQGVSPNAQGIRRVYLLSCYQGIKYGGLSEIVANIAHGARETGKTVVVSDRGEASERATGDGVTEGKGGRVVSSILGKSANVIRRIQRGGPEASLATYDSAEAVANDLLKQFESHGFGADELADLKDYTLMAVGRQYMNDPEVFVKTVVPRRIFDDFDEYNRFYQEEHDRHSPR